MYFPTRNHYKKSWRCGYGILYLPTRNNCGSNHSESKGLSSSYHIYERNGLSRSGCGGWCSNCYKKLKSNLDDRSIISNLKEEIKKKRSSFVHLSFEYTPWKPNEVVHALAARGHDLPGSIYWMEEVPMIEEESWNDEGVVLSFWVWIGCF